MLSRSLDSYFENTGYKMWRTTSLEASQVVQAAFTSLGFFSWVIEINTFFNLKIPPKNINIFKSKRAFRTKQKMFACNQNEKINWGETHLILSFCKGEHRASCAAEIQKRHKHKKTNGYSLFSVYFLFSVFTVKPPTQKTQNKPKTSPQYDCSPDRVSTAIRCHKATGSQCASVAGTSLGTNK